MKSFYLRKEFIPLRGLDKRLLDEPMLAFSWAMIAPDKYVVISPKIFNKSPGDTVTVMSEKQFAKMFRKLNVEAL